MSASQGDYKLHEVGPSTETENERGAVVLWNGLNQHPGVETEGLHPWKTPSGGLKANTDTSSFRIPTGFKYIPPKI